MSRAFQPLPNKAMFCFWRWHFQRGEHFDAFLETSWKLIAQANCINSARPFQFKMISAFICNRNWALHAPVQAHAWRPSSFMHTLCSCLQLPFAINKSARLHNLITWRRLLCCTTSSIATPKGILTFFSKFQIWISTSLVDFQTHNSLTLLHLHL